MNLFMCFLLTAAIILSLEQVDARHHHHHHHEIEVISPRDLLLELELEIQELQETAHLLSRARRAPQGISCGAKFLKRVYSLCDGPCTTDSGKNIATKCCREQCPDDVIQRDCCPESR